MVFTSRFNGLLMVFSEFYFIGCSSASYRFLIVFYGFSGASSGFHNGVFDGVT